MESAHNTLKLLFELAFETAKQAANRQKFLLNSLPDEDQPPATDRSAGRHRGLHVVVHAAASTCNQSRKRTIFWSAVASGRPRR